MKAVLLLLTFFSVSISFLGNPYIFYFGKFGITKTTYATKKIHETVATTSKNTIYKGFPHTEESRAKISKANKGKIPWNVGKNQTDETRHKISESLRENAAMLKEKKAKEMGMTMAEYNEHIKTKRKTSKKDYQVKYRNSTHWKEELSERMKHRWTIPEYRERYLQRNHTVSEATRLKLSVAIKQKWKDPAYREVVMPRLKATPESRVKASDIQKTKWQDAEFRATMIEKMRLGKQSSEANTRISESIRIMWQDPQYRNKTVLGNNLKNHSHSTKTIIKKSSKRSRKKGRKNRAAVTAAISRRKRVLREAQKLFLVQQLNTTMSLKDYLGEQIWSEEKLARRSSKSESLLTDDQLATRLIDEWTAKQQQQPSASGEKKKAGRKRDRKPKEGGKNADGSESSSSPSSEKKTSSSSEGSTTVNPSSSSSWSGNVVIEGKPLRDLDEEIMNSFVEVYDGDQLVGVFTQAEYEEYLAATGG